jgi:hypothetical protein
MPVKRSGAMVKSNYLIFTSLLFSPIQIVKSYPNNKDLNSV